MYNQEIREVAKSNGVKLWQIAYKLGLTDGNFSRKLRKELSETEKKVSAQLFQNYNRKEPRHMTNIPTMLTIKSTAKRTGLAEHYIRSLCWSGRIVHVKCGKKYLVNLEKLLEFLNSGDALPSQDKQPIRQLG